MTLLLVAEAVSAGPQPEARVCEAARDKGFVQGRGGFLFRTLDLRDEYTLRVDMLGRLLRLLDALEGQGVTLVVPVVPSRGMAMPDLPQPGPHDRPFDAEASVRSYEGVVAWLEAQGVLAVDLLAVATDPQREVPYYHRYDHHWTADGARDSALATAAVIRARPEYDALHHEPFVTRRVGVDEEVSSVARLFNDACGEVVPAVHFERYQTEPVEPPGLLDEPVPPEVVVVGSSFMRTRFNYSGFLSEALDADVLNVATPGGRATASLHSYLLSDDYRDAPPAFLVWEWVMTLLVDLREQEGSASFQDPALYRELIPAVYGDCGPDAVAEVERDHASGRVALFSPDVPLQGPEAYLSMTLEPEPSGPVRVVALHEGGERDAFTFHPYTRVDRQGRYLMELSDTIDSPLDRLHVVLPEDADTQITARLCLAPEMP
ncbi:MAG: hypothetical protein H6739_08495 [Alphaproteobacteria bacterium]|nr:hypothetical protein [Alphaproteobacteria bacterium]